MQAKFIYEKFKEESDPIKDMNIGIEHAMKKFLKDNNFIVNSDILQFQFFMRHEKYNFTDYLLEKGFDINTPDVEFGILLTNAAYKERWDDMIYLIKNGADLYKTIEIINTDRLKKSYTNLLYFKEHYKNGVLTESLNEKFTDESDPIHDMGIGIEYKIKDFVDNHDTYNKSGIVHNEKDYLWICARAGKTSFVEYLLNKGYDVHYRYDYAIRWACKYNHLKIIKLLLDAGADLSVFGEARDYAEQYAAKGDDRLNNLLKKYKNKNK